MSRTKQLLKNTSILVVAKISTQVVNFLLLPLYTALLSTAQYGEVDIYTSLAMIVIPFLTLQVEMGIFRYFISCRDEQSRQQTISTGFAVIGVVLLLVTLIYILVSVCFPFRYSILLYFFYLSQTISLVLLQVCRSMGDNFSYGLSSFIASSLAVVLNIIFIAILRMGVEGILYAAIIAQVMSSIYMLRRTRVLSLCSWNSIDTSVCRNLLSYSVPLVFNQISSWAINYSDRIIILHFWGMSLNGIYAIANKFSNVTMTFFGMYNLAWTESVVRCIQDVDSVDYINRLFELTFKVYLILIIAIINILPFIFPFMVDEEYHDAYYHVPILLTAMFFSGMAATIGSIYLAYNKTKNVSITTTMAGICNVIVHFALLNYCGLYAASISTLVSFALLFIYRFIFVRSFMPLTCSPVRLLPQLAVLCVAWLAYVEVNYPLIFLGGLLNLYYVYKLATEHGAGLKAMFRRK
ncbi:lipopolysaccharide biosynthesis protein [Selenomonas ruminantium]|uniref:lipopolysaccharide biosynthesis protein n=1 Tax=Selenomonas ruminantium TaxID=971 RepID=UPI0026EB5BA8|nr:oligosaccharide flippase family protein [Selenomonas ruminantium]